MAKQVLIIILIMGVSLGATVSSSAQDERSGADNKTKRLAPASFPQLPRNIARYLQSRKCRIPQLWDRATPHNAIRGMFAIKGRYDWAVLCSDGKTSSILILWGGSTKSVSEIAKASDKSYLQVVDGKGTIGYSRAISVIGKDFILDHYKAYGGPKPPPIRHQGINDIFDGKASVVYYRYRGKWIELQGAD